MPGMDIPDKDGIEAAQVLLKNVDNSQIIIFISKRRRFNNSKSNWRSF